MDTKLGGIPAPVFETALEQARQARLTILDKIQAAIPQAREELSPYAPRIFVLSINPEKIGEVIGPGGKVIKKIQAETGAKIDIEQDGTVYVACVNAEGGEKARDWIRNLTREVQVGEVYDGKVVRLMNFGAFVELIPGKDGLVHVSKLARGRVERPEDVVKIGDEIKVRVAEIDGQGRINLVREDLPDAPAPRAHSGPSHDDAEGQVGTAYREARDRESRGGGGSRGGRGGSGGRDRGRGGSGGSSAPRSSGGDRGDAPVGVSFRPKSSPSSGGGDQDA
jgi:polyribonucleotide nucleotidyltransferase